jgi:FkbM family methyltransferase
MAKEKIKFNYRIQLIIANILLKHHRLDFLWPFLKKTSLSTGEDELIGLIDIREGQTVLEAGARAGGLTTTLAGVVGKTGKVISIEPNPYSFNALCHLTEKFDNVIKLNVALGEKNGSANLMIERPFDIGGYIATTADSTSRKAVTVKTVSMDYLCENLNLSRIDFSIIDCEGMELNVLKGAEQSLKRGIIDNLLIEIHSTSLLKEVSDYLAHLNFEAKIVRDDPGSFPIMRARLKSNDV